MSKPAEEVLTESEMVAFRARIREMLETMNQTQLGNKLGVSQSTISKIDREDSGYVVPRSKAASMAAVMHESLPKFMRLYSGRDSAIRAAVELGYSRSDAERWAEAVATHLAEGEDPDPEKYWLPRILAEKERELSRNNTNAPVRRLPRTKEPDATETRRIAEAKSESRKADVLQRHRQQSK